jgi:hypothetical protein
MAQKDEKIYECIYEGIFIKESIKDNLINNYKQFIKILDSKNGYEFTLRKEEINKVINFDEKAWNFIKCNVISITNHRKEVKKYEIALFITNIANNRQKMIIRTFYKDIYKYYYKGLFYLCFIEESLKNKFAEIEKIHEFNIIQKKDGKDKFIDPDNFFNLFIPEFTIKVIYKFEEIKLEDIKSIDIYNMPKIIKGNNLNQKLGLYINLSKDDYYNFIYYQTEERKNLINSLIRLFGHKHYIGLCGPFGTGKTITLLKFAINSPFYHIFYINLWTIENTSLEELRNLFKYESIKLFGLNIFNEEDAKFCSSTSKTIFWKIIELIEKFDDKTKIFLLLENIISLLSKIYFRENIYIIIDQYSSKYDMNNESIKKLLNQVKFLNDIYIIVSSSMNNDDIKKNFADSLNHDKKYAEKKHLTNLKLIYYYIGCFIRLNTLEDYNNFTKNKSRQFIKYLNYFGNIPLFYYELSKIPDEKAKLEQYMEEEKYKIIQEINLFYGKKFKSKPYDIDIILDVLKILTIVNQKEIYLIGDLAKEILNLPLKFLEIKKENISINDLKIFAYASKNDKLIEKFKKNEKESDNKIINSLIEYDEDLYNFTQYVNEDNYCSNYIKSISINKRKKILKEKYISNDTITVYYLDHLFPYMDEIYSNMAYELLLKTSQYFMKFLPGQTQGGFLEYIINEYIKNNQSFMNFQVKNFENVECFVPNNFFIKNYSSRLKETIKIYIENKGFESNIKIDLGNENTFIKQNQFTGKYYDCALLIYNSKTKKYILYLFQISKKKIASNRYYREEHKIIFNRVKKYLEQKYSITIEEGHFSYIFIAEEKDDNTIKFCEENSLKYLLFSVEKVEFQNKTLELDEKSLITKKFPIHSSFSILPKEKIVEAIKDNKKAKKYIAEMEEKIELRELPKKVKGIISQFFIPKDNAIKPDDNDFFIVSDFPEYFNVNPKFCLWFNNEELSIKYYDKNDVHDDIVLDDLDKRDKLSDIKYTLICSKFKIRNIYNDF